MALDSLNEIQPKDEAAFCERAPRLLHLGSPLLLTCRVLEWEERRKWTGWLRVTEIEMAPLNHREQRHYMRRFYREQIHRPDLLAGFEHQLAQNASLRKACESPILLCFACLLHTEGELSGAVRRTELYQRMRRRLFRGEWRASPHPPQWADGKIHERRVTTWLCEIALALFRTALEAKIFSLAAWDAAVRDPAAMAAAAEISPPVRPDELPLDLERCGFLVALPWRDDQPRWSFQHRSSLAYLAAAALAQRPREVWLKEVIEHLWFQPAWEDTLRSAKWRRFSDASKHSNATYTFSGQSSRAEPIPEAPVPFFDWSRRHAGPRLNGLARQYDARPLANDPPASR